MGISAAQTVDYRNVARDAGLTASFPNGGTTSKQLILETTGSGVAFIDYDNDGLPDLFVLSGPGSPSRMYHNEGHGKFRDVTTALGLTREGWAQGVCAGDFDNDGYVDLFVTYWGRNSLYRNMAGKRFEDVTVKMHLTQDRTRFNTGCAFVDYDNDGRLDLFVANYLKFDPAAAPQPGANPYCFYRGIAVNCGPRGLPFDRNILYHNEGSAFRDVSEDSGISRPDANYTLSVLTGDFNNDGLTDIYVACDRTPSILYINHGNGKFEDEALLRGVALDGDGKAMSGMGVTAADYRHTGFLNIFRTNFSDELETLYRNLGDGNFSDVTAEAGMGRNTHYVGWGTTFLDFENSGWPGLLLVNGHAFPEVDRLKIDIHYKEPPILYRNDREGFLDISARAGPALLEAHSSRGLAVADIENNGLLAAAVNNQNEPPSLLVNRAPAPNHWVELSLHGTKSNAAAIGAKVRLSAGRLVQMDEVRSGGSYLSQNDLRLHFGLGPEVSVDRIEITWPGGARQTLVNQQADRILQITEK